MSDADEWDFCCEVCGKTEPCLYGSERERRGICRSCIQDLNLCEGSNLASLYDGFIGRGASPCAICHQLVDAVERAGRLYVGIHVKTLKNTLEHHAAREEEEKKMAAKVQKGEKLYAIIEIGWEYNDEHYYRGESGGGTPTKVYRSKERAEDELDRLNGKWLRTVGNNMSFEEGFDSAPCGFELVEIEADLEA